MLGANGSLYADITVSSTNRLMLVYMKKPIQLREFDRFCNAMMCTVQFQKEKKMDVALSTCSLVIQSYATQASWQVISPLEFVTGYKPDFSHVRIFGLKCYKFQFKDGWINLRTGSSSASMWVTLRK